ncbi:MAG TPA: FecR domain-containing protein [Puia sp.]
MEQHPEHIAELILLLIKGEASGEQRRILEQWKQADPANQLFMEKIEKADYVPETLKELARAQARTAGILNNTDPRLLSSYKEPSKKPSAHPLHFLKRPWVRYAAALILVIAAIAYFRTITKKPVPDLAHHTQPLDIAPGRDRATLTLAGGQRILLDSVEGDILKQGDLTVVNRAGELKYKGAGSVVEYNTISTPNGGQYQVVLPDGSKVWLNAASSIKFPTAFTGNARNIEMTGEAYMEIVPKSQQPFIVKTRGMDIRVLGTSFNVNAYDNEPDTRTTLVSGSVKVTGIADGLHSSAARSVVLAPGQQSIIAAHKEIAMKDNADLDQVLAWKNGLFSLQNASLQQVMRQLERWYDIQVNYEGEITGLNFQGEINRGIPLSAVLKWFDKLGIKSRVEGRRVVIGMK